MSMKKRISRLLGVSLALAFCVSACFIPGRSFASPVSSDPDMDEMWNSEWFEINEWYDKTDITEIEGFRFHTDKETGLDYSIFLHNSSDWDLTGQLYALNSVDWTATRKDDSFAAYAHGFSAEYHKLRPDFDYFLRIDSEYPSSEGYSILVEATPYPLPKGSITSLKAGRKCLTVKYKKRAWTSKYQIAVRQKGSKKWKYYRTTKLKRMIKKLKSGKKYYVKVRSLRYYNGQRYDGKWSSTKSVKVK